MLVSILRDESVEPTTLDLSLLEDITNNFSADQEIDPGVLVVIPTMKKLMGDLSNKCLNYQVATKFQSSDKNSEFELYSSLMSVKEKEIIGGGEIICDEH
jgi:hypothetical protein